MTEASDKICEGNSLPHDCSAESSELIRPWQNPSRFCEHKVQFTYVSSSIIGIVLAGFAYPICLAIGFLIYNSTLNGPTGQLVSDFVFLVFYILIGGTFGIAISSFTGLISICLIIIMNRSMGYPLDARSAAVSAGSLAGYSPTVWILFAYYSSGGFTGLAEVGFFGPILAMTLGAIGAAWASTKYGGYDFSVATRRRKSRLSIMHLMIATTWVAAVFGIANFFGGLEFAIAAAGWFVLQAIMLGGIHVFRKLRRPGANQRSMPQKIQ